MKTSRPGAVAIMHFIANNTPGLTAYSSLCQIIAQFLCQFIGVFYLPEPLRTIAVPAGDQSKNSQSKYDSHGRKQLDYLINMIINLAGSVKKIQDIRIHSDT